MAELNDWNVTAGNNNDAPPDGWPESTMQYSEVNNTGREGMAVLARFHKDINGSLAAGGVADAYTVTLNAGYSAYFEGMRFRCSIPAENTGATTINVNTIGVQTVVNQAGSALGAGDLKANGIYEFIYDGTNFQLAGDVGGGSVLADQQVIIRADIVTATPPISEAVSAALDFQDKDGSDALGDIGFNGSNALVLRNQMRTGNVQILGTDTGGTEQTLVEGDPDGSMNVYHAGEKRMVTLSGGRTAFRSSGNTDTEDRQIYLEHANGTPRAFVGHEANNILDIQSLIHGAVVRLSGEDAGGILRVIVSGDPDGASTMYHAGAIALETHSSGSKTQHPTSNNPYHAFHDNSGTRLGYLQMGPSSYFLDGEIHGAAWNIRGEDAGGTMQNIFFGDPDAGTWLYHAGTVRLLTDSAGKVALRSDGNTDSEDRYLALRYQNGTDRARIGQFSDNDLIFYNLIHGGAVRLRGEDSGGSARDVFHGNPNGAASVYHDGVLNSQTSPGQWVLRSVGNTDTEDRYLVLLHQDGTSRARVGHVSTNILDIYNMIHSGHVRIRGENAAGTVREMFEGDPDDNIDLHHPAAAEAVLRTRQRTDADRSSACSVRDIGGTFRDIGFNLLPRQTISGGNHTLAKADQGKTLFYNEGIARSLILNNDANIPVDALFHYRVGPSGGTLTGDGGTGVTISWWNGTDYTTTAAGGNMTIGEGSGVIWKDTDTHYYIDGPNLS